MADGRAELEAQIRRLRELGKLVADAAPAVADAVGRELEQQIERGVGPDGTPWQLTQDGRQPLRGAARAVRTRALGNVVIVEVTGVEARHHLGAVRGKVKRPIIPTRSIPQPVAVAITKVIGERFDRTMGGR